MALSNIPKQNISELVFQQFRDAIARGEWPVGQKIPSETELANRLGVSRVSVRSALQRLASLGLVESRQGEGTFVREFSSALLLNTLLPMLTVTRPSMDSLLEFRLILDKEMAGLAAVRAQPGQIEAMWHNLAQHEACQNDSNQAALCDLEFHCLIAEATGNPLLIQVYAILREVLKTALYDIVAVMGASNALYYHRQIIQAIEAHDADRASQAMLAHVQDTIAAAGSGAP